MPFAACQTAGADALGLSCRHGLDAQVSILVGSITVGHWKLDRAVRVGQAPRLLQLFRWLGTSAMGRSVALAVAGWGNDVLGSVVVYAEARPPGLGRDRGEAAVWWSAVGGHIGDGVEGGRQVVVCGIEMSHGQGVHQGRQRG